MQNTLTDKDLLALAAKAAGITGTRKGEHGGPFFLDETVMLHREWNPLRNDGDALRLAVKLRMDIGFNEVGGCIYCEESMESVFRHHGDFGAATRRAIVRAAAELGQSR